MEAHPPAGVAPRDASAETVGDDKGPTAVSPAGIPAPGSRSSGPVISSATNPRLDAAIRYVKQGMKPIPCCTPASPGKCIQHRQGCERVGKRPLNRWRAFSRAGVKEIDVRRFWRKWPDANVAFITGHAAGLVGIDADSDEAEKFVEDALEEQVKPPVCTSARGRHFLFRYPGDRVIRCATKIGGMALDVKGEGGLLTVPPSVHASRHVYAWEDGIEPDLSNLPPLPPALVRLLEVNHVLLTQEEAAKRGFSPYPERPLLIDAALHHLGNAKRTTDRSSVECSCPSPDHPDEHPSAVLHLDGSITCFSHPGGRRTWSPQEWSSWPGNEWAKAFLGAPQRTPRGIRWPDLAMRVAWAITPAPMTDRREGGDRLGLRDGTGTICSTVSPAEARQHVGGLGLRLLAYLVREWQRLDASRDRTGSARPERNEVWWSARDAATALGYSRQSGGARLKALDATVRRLADVEVSVEIAVNRPGAPAKRRFEGPLVAAVEPCDGAPVGRARNRGRLVALHPAITYGSRWGDLYADIPIATLTVTDEETFLALLVLRREIRRRGGTVQMPLCDLLTNAGTSAAGLVHDPARTVERWRQRLRKLVSRRLLRTASVSTKGSYIVRASVPTDSSPRRR